MYSQRGCEGFALCAKRRLSVMLALPSAKTATDSSGTCELTVSMPTQLPEVDATTRCPAHCASQAHSKSRLLLLSMCCGIQELRVV